MKADETFRILIVEDEILIALGLEILVEDAGYATVGIATTSDDAIRLARSEKPNIALVDVHLADGPTGVEAARALVGEGTTVLFMTANAKRIPDDFAGACGTIPKPYTERSVIEALGYVAGHLAGRPGLVPPDGLTPSPHHAAAKALERREPRGSTPRS